ncbi:MAG TPA: UDP-3-O-(3-hydroxymyristoyl)glucosamine N-acyltransferase [Vicinamibacterales bacterium]|nr:UDP-3-O-(3-hydroxymyristoyl)glucosamine N-acyltransferase [Vicinamibacterales bacterium]
MTLRELAERLHCRLEGNGALEISRVSGIEHAAPGDLTFIANPKYQHFLHTTRASAVLVTPDTPRPDGGPALLVCDRPYLAFAQALGVLVQASLPAPGIDPTSVIADDAQLGDGVSIGAVAVIGAGARIGARTVLFPGTVVGPGAVIGDDCVLHARVSIRERVQIGNRVVVQDGAVIGSDGFGFVKQADGSHLKIPQHAGVVIEDDVEIGANTTIDRPAVGETRIRTGSKIDNLVQIAHGVSVGERALFAAQVGIAGSSVVEDDVVLAGQVGVAGHLRIGKGVIATAQTGVPNSVDPGTMISGYPAIPNRDWLKSSAVFRNLPALKKRVVELEQRIAELEEKLEACRPPSER